MKWVATISLVVSSIVGLSGKGYGNPVGCRMSFIRYGSMINERPKLYAGVNPASPIIFKLSLRKRVCRERLRGAPMKLNLEYHYKNIELRVPHNLAHRLISLVKMKQWHNFRVRKVDELRSALLKVLPDAAFISTACYLNPDNVIKKWSGNNSNPNSHLWCDLLNNTMLSSDFVADFDNYRIERHENNITGKIEKVKIPVNPGINARKTYGLLLEDGADEEDLTFTKTKRGYHLWDEGFYTRHCKKIANPYYRESHIAAQKTRIAQAMVAEGIDFDYDITVDTRRVVRLWNSVYNDGFTICRPIDYLEQVET